MSAFRQAVLSVAPERLEQFTMEVKKNINEKQPQKRKKSHSKRKDSSGHTKKRKKSVGHESKAKSSSMEKDKKKTSAAKNTKAKSDTKATSSKQKHETSTNKKIKNKKKRPKDTTKDDSDVDPKDLDLTVPLCSLTTLVRNRTDLLDTVFSIIKGPRLTSMLPDTLKLMPLDEIKRLCHEQLDVMSSKRVMHILSGTKMDSSSGTDSSGDEKSRQPQTLAHDSSLQTNLVDSTTEELPTTSKSMLFPSAVGTAHSKMTGSEILPKKVVRNSVAQSDGVSTSTEPNFIYTAEAESGTGEESAVTSDPEEGEVDSSEEEDKCDLPMVHKEQEIEEEVLVEEVEMEDYEEEHTKAEQAPDPGEIPLRPRRSREKNHPEEPARAEQALDEGRVPPKPRRSREMHLEEATRAEKVLDAGKIPPQPDKRSREKKHQEESARAKQVPNEGRISPKLHGSRKRHPAQPTKAEKALDVDKIPSQPDRMSRELIRAEQVPGHGRIPPKPHSREKKHAEEPGRVKQALDGGRIPLKVNRIGERQAEEPARHQKVRDVGKISPRPCNGRENERSEEDRIRKELIRTEESMRRAGRKSTDGERADGTSDVGADDGKSQLEILELELRARAIRSLMKAAQSGKLKHTGE